MADNISKYFSKASEYCIKSFSRGEYIYEEEGASIYCYRVLEGRVKIVRKIYGRRNFIHYIVYPNQIFGFMDINQITKKRRLSAIALDKKTTVEIIPFAEYKRMMKTSPEFQKEIAQAYRNFLKDTYSKLENQLTWDTERRICYALKDMATKQGVRTKKGIEFQWLTHWEFANFLGLTRQNVTTILKRLKDQGKIGYTRTNMIIKDLDSLKVKVEKE